MNDIKQRLLHGEELHITAGVTTYKLFAFRSTFYLQQDDNLPLQYETFDDALEAFLLHTGYWRAGRW